MLRRPFFGDFTVNKKSQTLRIQCERHRGRGLANYITVVGCAHGKLENIYDAVQYLERENDIKIDLLFCCGDFQATRNLDDLNCMSVPLKYRDICSFYKYYCGEKLAPILTIFVGGNHEASNYLQELPFGGWVAPNIFYLGYAGVVNFGGIRIAGISGIFSDLDYYKGRYEKPPYNKNSLKSCYHIRNLDIFRLKQLSQPVQIMLSHDWPAGISKHGNEKKLLENKPFFKNDIDSNSLGSRPTEELLHHLKPDYWFAAHLHVKFAALVEHKNESAKKYTRFLALDKCLPRRQFLQILEVPHNSEEDLELKYDLEWLTILYLTNNLVSVKNLNCYMPTSDCAERWNFTPTPEELEEVSKKFQNNLKIPHNFVATAPSYNPHFPNQSEGCVTCKNNPQTVEFCEKLGVVDPISLIVNEDGFNTSSSSFSFNSFSSSSFIEPTDSEFDSSESSFPGTSPFFRGGKMLRTPLKLPKPLNSCDISSEGCLTSTPYKLEVKSESCVPNKKNKVLPPGPTDGSSDSSSAPAVKYFKRRNIAIYEPSDEGSCS